MQCCNFLCLLKIDSASLACDSVKRCVGVILLLKIECYPFFTFTSCSDKLAAIVQLMERRAGGGLVSILKLAMRIYIFGKAT